MILIDAQIFDSLGSADHQHLDACLVNPAQSIATSDAFRVSSSGTCAASCSPHTANQWSVRAMFPYVVPHEIHGRST